MAQLSSLPTPAWLSGCPIPVQPRSFPHPLLPTLSRLCSHCVPGLESPPPLKILLPFRVADGMSPPLRGPHASGEVRAVCSHCPLLLTLSMLKHVFQLPASPPTRYGLLKGQDLSYSSFCEKAADRDFQPRHGKVKAGWYAFPSLLRFW